MAEATNMHKPAVILLDVYQTILDMSDVERKVNTLLESRRGYTIWFEMFMEYCFVDNCTTQFNDFSAIARATLQMAGYKLGIPVAESSFHDVLELMKHLPLQEGVQRGLSTLYDRGYRIAALTNADERIVCERMERTGLISYFEKVLSAAHVQKYKPCRDVYQWALNSLQVDAEVVLMVSAHGWDIAGAANAGLRTAHVKQGKSFLYPLAPSPEFEVQNLEVLAKELTDQWP